MTDAGRGPGVVVLTGAGVSAESGLRTFRDHGGLWEQHRIEDVATPEAFERNPELVQRFYNARREQLGAPGTKPNAAHDALARFEAAWPGDFLLVTQNVDDLHERAGSRAVVHMHGELLKARCQGCQHVQTLHSAIGSGSRCGACNRAGLLRPHIVWFGEMPLHMERIEAAVAGCGIFIAIGTSATVYPAAGFSRLAASCGAHTVELNLAASDAAGLFDESHEGPATELVPGYLQRLLRQHAGPA